MNYFSVLGTVAGWTALIASLILPIVVPFIRWSGNDHSPWWILAGLGLALIFLSIEIWVGITTSFIPTEQQARAQHCATGTTYEEYRHTILMPVTTGKSTILVPRTITDWRCVPA